MVLLPEGGQLSVGELREVAARQQQQIEAQQQLLVAKEQRLKFLKQQQRHGQQHAIGGPTAADPAPGPEQRLRALRDRVQMQELKLRRLRQLRGQVDQQHANNANLSAELDSIRALFNEKEKELSVAVAKVEELTRQLEDVRRSNSLQAGGTLASSPANAAHELDKLRKELLLRAQLTEQQSVRIAQQRESLCQRQGEVAEMDRRIAELQQRLHKKRLHNQELQGAALARRGAQGNLPPLMRRPNVAAVEPLQRGGPPLGGAALPSKKDPKYQTLPYNTKFSVKLRGEEQTSDDGPEPEPKKPKSPPEEPPVTVPPPPCPRPAEPGPPLPPPPDVPAPLPPVDGQLISPMQCRPSVTSASTPVANQPIAMESSRPAGTQIPTPSRLRPPSSLVSPNSKLASKGAQSLSVTESSAVVPPLSEGTTKGPRPSVPPKPAVKPHLRPVPSGQGYAETSLDDVDSSAPREVGRAPPTSCRHVPKPPLQRPASQPATCRSGGSIAGPPGCKEQNVRGGQPPCTTEDDAREESGDVHHSQIPCQEPSAPDGRTDGDGGVGEEETRSAANQDEQRPEERDGSPPAEEAWSKCAAKKGNLKTQGSAKNPHRVSFDPLALLLDAALEGELELVRKTALEVPNPSAANDEGITALHNAICAGHFDIVKFLVEFGCDVNAQDSDGWTPLHCAASCNNLAMVKFLVEHGACVFAATLSDHETAAEKCEEDEEGFDNCSEYLYSVQEKLGILNGGVAYGVFDYDAHNPDELSFSEGDMVLVLRKGDDAESHWWWARLRDHEGYLPRNLLGLYPRVKPCRDSGKDSGSDS